MQKKAWEKIVAKRDIPKDTVISADMVDIKVAEPSGIDPRQTDLFVGRIAKHDIGRDESICSDSLTTLAMEIVQYVD